MKLRHILNVPFVVFLLFVLAYPVWSQGSEITEMQKKSPRTWLMLFLSNQDVILPVSSIEWGIPDRWSISSRYVHMFEKDRNNKTWLNNLSITLSPGIAGGRLAFGYLGIISPKSMSEFAVLSEVRVLLLRTWGNPLSTIANLSFVGVEIRSSPAGMINFGIGYFTQIFDSNSQVENFYGLHIGFGI